MAEADSLVKAAFGPTMLKAIGKTYSSQAEIYLGNIFEGSIAAIKSKSSSMKSQIHALGLAIKVSIHYHCLGAETVIPVAKTDTGSFTGCVAVACSRRAAVHPAAE